MKKFKVLVFTSKRSLALIVEAEDSCTALRQTAKDYWEEGLKSISSSPLEV